MSWLVGVLIVIVAAAAVIDFRTRRIPNWLTFPSLALALALQFALHGGAGLVQGLLGVLVGAGLFLLPFLLGGMGAGDVKLMGVAGAFLGPAGALWAVLFTGVAGGVAVDWVLGGVEEPEALGTAAAMELPALGVLVCASTTTSPETRPRLRAKAARSGPALATPPAAINRRRRV